MHVPADCRLEAQYAHQQEVTIVPLMMEKKYRPTGWLGLILGTRLYFNLHPSATETDALFLQQLDLVERELGDRGAREHELDCSASPWARESLFGSRQKHHGGHGYEPDKAAVEGIEDLRGCHHDPQSGERPDEA